MTYIHPGGVLHSLDNTSGSEDIELITVWALTPPEGINPVYDLCLKQWGTSYKTIDDQ